MVISQFWNQKTCPDCPVQLSSLPELAPRTFPLLEMVSGLGIILKTAARLGHNTAGDCFNTLRI